MYTLVFNVADLPDCGRAFRPDKPHFTGRQTDVDFLSLFCQELRGATGAAH
jgi:hypothetical protein